MNSHLKATENDLLNTSSLEALNFCYINQPRDNKFFSILDVLVNSFRFIWIPKFCVYVRPLYCWVDFVVNQLIMIPAYSEPMLV